MKAAVQRLVRQIGSVLIQPARRRFEWADQTCAQAASVSETLFGISGASTEALHRYAKRQSDLLEIHERMWRSVSREMRTHYFWDAKPTLTMPRLCDVNEFHLPEIRSNSIALNHDPDDIHRKYWEKAAVGHTVHVFGYDDQHSRGLGLGVGKENLLYMLTNNCGHVTGIDQYAKQTGGAGMTIGDVYQYAPFPYNKERLEIRPCVNVYSRGTFVTPVLFIVRKD